MKLIKIKNIEILSTTPNLLGGCAVDIPEITAESSSYYLDIVGWVLGEQQAVLEVLVMDMTEHVYARLPLNVVRSDVASYFPQVNNAAQSGFSGSVNVIGLSVPEAELFLCAVLANGVMVRFAKIALERTALQISPNCLLQPLLVNSIGRTGTTWLMRLLLEHERVVTYPDYPYEARIASYWLHSVLKAPALHPPSQDLLDLVNLDWMNWQLCLNPQPTQWFRRTYQEQLGAFCCASIDQAYLQFAQQQGKPLEQLAQHSAEPVYFAEKFGLGYVLDLLWELYPQTREIVLVRDFRDMLCSILKFTEKPANQRDFGRDKQLNEEEFIQHTAANVQLLVNSWQQRQHKSYLLRYEDLILKPEQTLSKLLAYLRLDNSPAKITRLLEKAAKDTGYLQDHRTSSSAQASIGRWQKELNDTQKALVNKYFAEYLKLFDYPV